MRDSIGYHKMQFTDLSARIAKGEKIANMPAGKVDELIMITDRIKEVQEKHVATEFQPKIT